MVSTIKVPLPSKGLVYSEQSPLFRKEEVEIREMTANEEDILTSLTLIKTGKVIDEVVKACLIDKSINASEMLVGDRNAIVTGLVLASYGSKYNVDVTCEMCKEVNKNYEFNVNELPIHWLETQPVVQGVNEFEFLLPKSKKKITFSLATSEDEREISTVVTRLKNSTNREPNVTVRMKKLILSIDANRDKRFIADWIDRGNMPIADSVALRDYIDQIAPDIDTHQDFHCNLCGYSGRVVMPIDFNFFWRTGR